jgi:hypothetical protein
MPTVPTIEWLQHSTAIDPSGSRHLKSGAAGYLKTLTTGAGGQLDFGGIDVSLSGSLSSTQLCFARVSNFNGASGIYNLKFFLSNVSAFTAGTYRFFERKSLPFLPSLSLTEADAMTPTSVPTVPNIKGTIAANYGLGQTSISGILDQDVTQYLYLAVYAGTDVPLSQYGGAGAATFRYTLLFDFN